MRKLLLLSLLLIFVLGTAFAWFPDLSSKIVQLEFGSILPETWGSGLLSKDLTYIVPSLVIVVLMVFVRSFRGIGALIIAVIVCIWLYGYLSNQNIMKSAKRIERPAVSQQVVRTPVAPRAAAVPKAIEAKPCTDEHAEYAESSVAGAGKAHCFTVKLPSTGARYTLPYIPAEKCWDMWQSDTSVEIKYEKKLDGIDVWADRNLEVLFLEMHTDAEAFVDSYGHTFVCD